MIFSRYTFIKTTTFLNLTPPLLFLNLFILVPL
jgi:hypothetical protein